MDVMKTEGNGMRSSLLTSSSTQLPFDWRFSAGMPCFFGALLGLVGSETAAVEASICT